MQSVNSLIFPKVLAKMMRHEATVKSISKDGVL